MHEEKVKKNVQKELPGAKGKLENEFYIGHTFVFNSRI